MQQVVVGRPLKPETALPNDGRKRLKLTRDREHKRRLRVEYVQEVHDLRAAVVAMANKVEALHSARGGRVGPLSWRDVAAALDEAVAHARRTNVALASEVERFHKLRQALEKEHPISVAPTLKACLWRDAYLFDDEDLRRSGYDWITTSMYHTAPLDKLCHGVDVDMTSFVTAELDGHIVRMTAMLSTVVRASFTHATNMARRHPLEVQAYRQKKDNVTAVLDRAANSTLYIRNTGIPGYSLNVVSRQFVHDDWSLLVTRSVIEDESFPYLSTEYRSDAREWTLVKPLGDSTCLIRQYVAFTQPFLGEDKVVPLAEFAPLFLGKTKADEFADADDQVVLQRVKNKMVQSKIAQWQFEDFMDKLRLTTPDGPMVL